MSRDVSAKASRFSGSHLLLGAALGLLDVPAPNTACISLIWNPPLKSLLRSHWELLDSLFGPALLPEPQNSGQVKPNEIASQITKR